MKRKNYTYTPFRYYLLLILTLLFSRQEGVTAQNRGLGLQLPKLRAVVIGVSNYIDRNIPDLNYADKDARAFARALDRVQDVQLDTVLLLTEAQATYENMYNALEWVTMKSKPGDIIVFFFSGHGDNEMKAGKEKGYLLAHNTPRTNYRQFAFAHSELGEYLEAWVNKDIKVYLFADACHAGKIAGNKSEMPGKYLANNNLQLLAGITQNLMEILSCKGDQESIERSDLAGGHGVFTYYLLKGLMGEADLSPRDKQIKVHEFKRYLSDSVRMSAKPTMQNPHITGDDDNHFLSFKPDRNFFGRPVKKMLLPAARSVPKDSLLIQFNRLLEAGHYFLPEGDNAHRYFKRIQTETLSDTTRTDVLFRFRAAILAENTQILQRFMNQDFEPWTSKLEDIEQGVLINLALTAMQREASAAYGKSYANLYFFKSLAWYEYSKFGDPAVRAARLNAAQDCINVAKKHLENSAFIQLLNVQISSALAYLPGSKTPAIPEATRAAFEVTRDCAPGWRLPYLMDGTEQALSTYDSLATIYALQNQVSWYATDTTQTGRSTERWHNQLAHNPVLAEDLLYSYALRYTPAGSPDNQGMINYGLASNIENVSLQLTDPGHARSTAFVPGSHYTKPLTSPEGADQTQLFALLNSLKPYDDLPGFSHEQLADSDLDGVSDQLVQQIYSGAVNDLKLIDYATMGSSAKDPRVEAQLNRVSDLLREEKPGEVIVLLQEIRAKNNTLYLADVEWLTALAWLIRQPAKGMMLLNKIAENPLQTHRLEARGLVFKLNR